MSYLVLIISCLNLVVLVLGLKKLQQIRSEESVLRDASKRQTDYIAALIKWHQVRSQNISLQEFLLNKGIKSLSIYGAGEVGKLLLGELKDSLEVRYFLDNSPQLVGEEIEGVPVRMPVSVDHPGDAVLITVLQDVADEIKNELQVFYWKTEIYLFGELLTAMSVSQKAEGQSILV